MSVPGVMAPPLVMIFTRSAPRSARSWTARRSPSQAGVPAGSASNHFRTRDALLDAVVQRFAARERALWEDLAMRMCPTTPHELAQVLVAAAKTATGPQRTLTLARCAILVEAGVHPAIRAQLLSPGGEVNTWFMTWLRVAAHSPQRHHRE